MRAWHTQDPRPQPARQAQACGLLAGRAAWLAHPLFAAARQRPDVVNALLTEFLDQLPEPVSAAPARRRDEPCSR
jgi:hypothetical protein